MAKSINSTTERIGVNAVEQIILKMNWIFREQPIVDIGVDAHLEIDEKDISAGRLIAIQIKTGISHIKMKKESMLYYFDEQHYQYWINHSLPVIVIFHLPIENKTYWQLINSKTVQNTGKGWKVEIPYIQVFNEHAKTKLIEIAREPEPSEMIFNASSKLDSFSPNWGVDFHKHENNIFYYPKAKHEKADEIEPLNFTFTFNRELVAQNKSVHDLLYNPELVNQPVHIPMEMIIDVQSGDFLKKAMNIQEIGNGFVIIPIKQTPNKYEFSFIDIYSNEFMFDNIELSCEKEENDIAVFSNRNQDVPYKLTFTFEKEILNKNKITFSMFVKKHGYELKNILKGLKLFNSLSNGGIIKFREKSSQKELYTQEIATGFISINYKEYINLLERIYFIQMKTNINTIILNNGINNDQIFEINKLYYILQGYLSIQDFESWKIILPVDKAKEIFFKLNNDRIISFYDLDENFEIDFFDNKINLGSVHSYCNAVYITEEEKRKIDEQFNNNHYCPIKKFSGRF